MMLKDFGLRRSRSSSNGDASDRSNRRSSDSTNKSATSLSKKAHSKSKGECVAERLKEMSPHNIIVTLEMYAVTDNKVAFEAFQSLKKSEPRLSTSIKSKQNSRREN
jgi:hypothetical protein